MCIEEVHLSLTRAAQAAYGFFSVSSREKVYILQKSHPLEFVTVDRQTFHAARGTMRFSACTIIFYGGLVELTELAAGVPPSLFHADAVPTTPLATTPHEGDN